MNWFMGGLNFQIEHHLFPMMPRHNLPVIKPRVVSAVTSFSAAEMTREVEWGGAGVRCAWGRCAALF